MQQSVECGESIFVRYTYEYHIITVYCPYSSPYRRRSYDDDDDMMMDVEDEEERGGREEEKKESHNMTTAAAASVTFRFKRRNPFGEDRRQKMKSRNTSTYSAFGT